MERTAAELSHVIRSNFLLHPARAACFLAMIWGMISAKRVQLWALAEEFGGQAQQESRLQRITRFLREQLLPWECVARCVVELLGVSAPWTLVMDRTNWQYGKIDRNYLVLAIVYRGNAIPLLVQDLGHAGNSSTDERIALMERFLAIFGKDKVYCLLADREFVGEDWFKWLQQNGIPPCIRTRENMLVRHKNGGKVPVKTLLRSLNPGEYRLWEEQLYGATLQMIGLKLTNGDYLILLASQLLKVELLPLYKIRWTIECLFKNTKSSGFCWEGTHLVHPERAEKLAAILTLATVLAAKEGALQHALKPIPFKKTIKYPLFSLFLYGLRSIADAFKKNVLNPISNPLILNARPESVW
jgi:hypothetical protein